MENFIQFCKQFTVLNDEARNDLAARLKPKDLARNEYLVKQGQVCRHLCFIIDGVIKLGFCKEGKEFIMRFFSDKELFTALDSFSCQEPSAYYIRAIVPTQVLLISRKDLEELCQKHHCIETFFRKFVTFAGTHMMERISEMLEENATTRYLHFVAQNRHLLPYLSLGNQASYLGITQVSLSRIRAQY